MAINGLDGKQLALPWGLDLSVICSLWLPLPNEKNIHSTDKVLVVQWWPLVFWQSTNEAYFFTGLLQCHLPFGFQSELWSHQHICTRSCLRNMLSSVPVTRLWSSTVINSVNFQPHNFLWYYKNMLKRDKKSGTTTVVKALSSPMYVQFHWEVQWKQ